jgi:hypothetical protein
MTNGDKVTIKGGSDIWVIYDIDYDQLKDRVYCTHDNSAMGASLHKSFLELVDKPAKNIDPREGYRDTIEGVEASMKMPEEK